MHDEVCALLYAEHRRDKPDCMPCTEDSLYREEPVFKAPFYTMILRLAQLQRALALNMSHIFLCYYLYYFVTIIAHSIVID